MDQRPRASILKHTSERSGPGLCSRLRPHHRPRQYKFGARTGHAPILLGCIKAALGLLFGGSLVVLLEVTLWGRAGRGRQDGSFYGVGWVVGARGVQWESRCDFAPRDCSPSAYTHVCACAAAHAHTPPAPGPPALIWP
jgi:hypothetical protein